MDNRAEEEASNDQLRESKRKLVCAFRAIDYYDQQIASTGIMNPGDAAFLGFQILVYMTEQTTHDYDMHRIEFGTETDAKMQRIKIGDAKGALDTKHMNEAVIIEALQRNLRPLKEWVRDEYIPFVEPNKDMPEGLLEKLGKIVEVMPEQYSGLQMPMPAWMDSRFNGEGTSQ